jgi:hypothetical protein
MVTCPGRVLRFAVFSAVLWAVGAVGSFAQDFGNPFESGAAYSNGPLQLALTTDKGCGGVFKDGDPITIWFRAGKSATLTMTNSKPDGLTTTPVSNLMANGGWLYRIDSSVGMPLGTRTLRLYARAGNVTDSVECSFTVISNGPAPIVAHLSTDRGCGEQAVYQRGEPVMVSWSVEESATVRLVLERPDGEVVLRDDFPAQANEVYTETGNAGLLVGARTLRLTATNGDRSGFTACRFQVVESLPQTPLIALFQTNKGCGSGAVFQDGDPITFLLQLNETALVTLTNTRPNGSSVLLDNEFVTANTLIHLDRLVGQPMGTRTLTLIVYTATRTETQQCTYEVISKPIDNSIQIALSTNRGTGSGAVFKTDESMQINFMLSTHAFVRVRIVGPFSTQQLLNNYEVDGNHPVHLVLGVGEPVGTRTIIIDALSGEHGGHAELSFNVAQ